MSERKFKKRNHNLVRSPLFDEYITNEMGKLAYYEKMKLAEALGKKPRHTSVLETYTLDRKLLLLTHMNKKFFLMIFDKDSAANFNDFEKVFQYYISGKNNYDSEEKRRELNVFCLDQRAVAKHYMAGAFRFSDPVYKTANDGTLHKFVSSFRTPNIAISQTERTERNFDVYKMFSRLLVKGYYLDNYLKPYQMDYGHMKILINLFVAEKPLNREETIDTENILNYYSRTDPSPQRLNYLVAHKYVDEHEFADEESEKTKRVFTISAKGISTYLDVVNTLLKDEK